MSKIYKDFKEGNPLKGLARISAILILIMVWILIDKGNVYGQDLADDDKLTVKSEKLKLADAFLKAGGDDDNGMLDDDSDDDNSFVVYPNPVEGDLVFDFEFTVKEASPFEIIDMQGKLVESGLIKPGLDKQKLDVKQLKSGLYIVRLELGGKLHVKRLVKK